MVPIYRVCRLKQWMNLNHGGRYTSSNEYQRFARGRLIGNNNLEISLEKEIDFIGNFDGVF